MRSPARFLKDGKGGTVARDPSPAQEPRGGSPGTLLRGWAEGLRFLRETLPFLVYVSVSV